MAGARPGGDQGGGLGKDDMIRLTRAVLVFFGMAG